MTLEGAAAVGVAVVFVVRGLLGHEKTIYNGYGTAAWFAILGGAVLAAGIALIVGKRWGRAIAIVAQLLLLPVAWTLLTGPDRLWLGILLTVVVVGALGCLFSGPTSRWMEAQYGEDPEVPDQSER